MTSIEHKLYKHRSLKTGSSHHSRFCYLQLWPRRWPSNSGLDLGSSWPELDSRGLGAPGRVNHGWCVSGILGQSPPP